MDFKIPLPIDSYKKQILDLIAENDVIIVSSSTGSGKSTRIPQFIFEDNPDIRLIVTQPRRIAATKLAERVADELGETLGDGVVGYRISMESVTTKDTLITFVTTGTLGAMLCEKGQNVKKLTHIIVDEVHCKDIHTDLVLLEIRLLKSWMTDWNPKILLLSATVDIRKLSSYFDDGKGVGVLEVPQVQRIHPLDIYYIDDLEEGIHSENKNQVITVTDLCNYTPKPDTNNSNYNQVAVLVNQLSKLETCDSVKGAVLVFLPGIAEITEVGDKLRKFARTANVDWVIKEMHSNLTDEQHAELFPSVQPSQRKIVLATNIAESSLTINDVKYVVDLCLARVMMHDSETGFSTLSTVLASNQQCDQRAGRAGRTSPGICFRIVTKYFYDNGMSMESRAEMQLSGLNLAFLHVKKLNLGKPKDLLMETLNPPPIHSILSAVSSLKECGALIEETVYDDEDGKMTVIGLLAVTLSCDPKLARLIAFGRIFGFLNEAVIIAMCLASKPVFAQFHNDSETGVNAHISKINAGGRGHSDALAYVGAYNIYLDARREHHGTWLNIMKANFIKSSVMRSIDYTIQRVFRKLNMYMQIHADAGVYNVETILQTEHLLLQFHLMMSAASYPNVFARHHLFRHHHHLAKVSNETGYFKPADTMIFEPKEDNNIRPSQDQLNQLCNELQRKVPSRIPPLITCNGSLILVNYNVEEHEKIGNVPEQVIRAMKWKAFNHFFSWKTVEGSEEKVVQLKGPRSSIGINFLSAFQINRDSKVRIHRESVNLCTFDENYPVPTTYCVASMQVTIRGFNIIAKDSTLLKPIPGLFENLHLLFGRTVQLFSCSNGNLAGCIAGLGPIPGTSSTHPAPLDQLVTFDIKIGEWEVHEINRLRLKIGRLLDLDHFISMSVMANNGRRNFVSDVTRFILEPKTLTNNYRMTSFSWIQQDGDVPDFLMPIKWIT